MWSVLDGLPEMSNCCCLPGRAGGLPAHCLIEKGNRRSETLPHIGGYRDIGKNDLELLLDSGLDCKGIEFGMLLPEGGFGVIGTIRMIHHALVGCLWWMIAADVLGAITVFRLEFKAGAEVIL